MLSFTSCTDTGYFFEADAEEIVVHTDSPGVATVHGGVPPYRWEITGTAFRVHAWNTATGDNRVAVTETYQAGISVEEITVTDRCGSEVSIQVVGCIREVCCDRDTYAAPTLEFEDYEEGADEVRVNILNGCPPFRWTSADWRIGMRHKYTSQRMNTLFSLSDYGFLFDPVMYVVDECGNGVGNAYTYSYYFPFQYTADDLVGATSVVPYGNAAVVYNEYVVFDTVTYAYSLLRLGDTDLFYVGSGLAHIHAEFYVDSAAVSTTNYFTIMYQIASTIQQALTVRYEATEGNRYVQFNFQGTDGEAVQALYPWELRTWVSVDVTRDASGYTNVYVNGTKLATSAHTYAWPQVNADLYLGAKAGAGSPVQVFKLRLRNCFFLKGEIHI